MSLFGPDDVIFIQVRFLFLPAIFFFLSFPNTLNGFLYQANHSRHSKGRKRGLGECRIILIFRAKHENEVEAWRSEKLPVKQKCQSLLT